MKKSQMLMIALLAQSLVLPAWAATTLPSQTRVTELTSQEAQSKAYRHTGDISLTNYRGTSEEALKKVRERVEQQGDGFYRVTRLQMMENSSWSANAATYTPAQNAGISNPTQDEES